MMFLSLKTKGMRQKIGGGKLACRAIDIDSSLGGEVSQPLATCTAGGALVKRRIGGHINAGHGNLRDWSCARRDSSGQSGSFRAQRQAIARNLNIHARKKLIPRDHHRTYPKMRIGAMGTQGRLPGLPQ